MTCSAWRAAVMWTLLQQPACAAEPLRAPNVVGCPSDGMSGPVPAPARKSAPMLHASLAGRVSYYASPGGMAVLAPSGWHCLQLYGSGGANLFVTPSAHAEAELYADHAPLSGPVVLLQRINGWTSGRDQVARVAARLYPTRPDLVRRAEEDEPDMPHDFPSGPYPADTLVRHGPADVEYATPAGRSGMGTDGRLAVGGTLVTGAAVLTAQGNLVKVDVRLPPSLAWLAQPIVAQVRAGALAEKAPGRP